MGNEKDELIYYPNFAGRELERANQEGERIGIRVVTPVIMRNNVIDCKKAERERNRSMKSRFIKAINIMKDWQKNIKN